MLGLYFISEEDVYKTSAAEFLTIIEENAVLQADGSIVIESAEAAEKYEDYIKGFARPAGAQTAAINVGCTLNIVCKPNVLGDPPIM